MKSITFKFKKNKRSDDIEALAVNLIQAERFIQKAWDDSNESLLCSDADKLIKLREMVKYTRLGMEDHLIKALQSEGKTLITPNKHGCAWELTEQAMKARGLIG